MELLSEIASRMNSSPTSALTDMVDKLVSDGRQVISLGAGEPDFATPEHVCDAAIAAIRTGKTRYSSTGGIAPLKQAICRKFQRENGLEYRLEEVVACAGGKQVIFSALMATLREGDEVVIPAPYWVSYPGIAKMFGAKPVVIETQPASGFKPSSDQIRNALTDRTRWLLLNSPSNPSGAVLSAGELRAIADVLQDFPQVMVLSDDIYEHIVFDGKDFQTLAAVAPELKSRILICNGVSKAYAMTGWRIGYGVGPAWLISLISAINSQSTTQPCTISQWASVAALEGQQDFLAEALETYCDLRDLTWRMLNECKGLECTKPEGAFYAYPSIASCIGKTSSGGRKIQTDADFCAALLEEQGVATMQGAAFGLSPFFRVSFAGQRSSLVEAYRRIRLFCEGLT